MAETFDPYRKWLGILPSEQPPHNYRLLGIGLFEDDPDVIENAADQRMAYLRSYQSGPNSEASQRLLNEVAAAKLCLLSTHRKAFYDAELRRSLSTASPTWPYFPITTAIPVAVAGAQTAGVIASERASSPEKNQEENRDTGGDEQTINRTRLSLAVCSAAVVAAAAFIMAGGLIAAKVSARSPLSGRTAVADSATQNEDQAAEDPSEAPASADSGDPQDNEVDGAGKTGDAPKSSESSKPATRNSDDPAPAIAPFDEEQAHDYQRSWARHIGTTVSQRNSLGMSLVLIPPGEFTMGSTAEQIAAAKKLAASSWDQTDRWTLERFEAESPAHRVKITRPFLMSATEVTTGQFRRFVEATNYVTETERRGGGNSTSRNEQDPQKKVATWRGTGAPVPDEVPVGQVTWSDAVAFCNWLSQTEGRAPCYRAEEESDWLLQPEGDGYRLPTEAEWEYACRAGTSSQYSFGDDLSRFGQYVWSSRIGPMARPRVGGAKKPNPFGLFDMHGGSDEWCQDWFDVGYYSKSPLTDPKGPDTGVTRVHRGGGADNYLARCRSAFRIEYPPFWRFENLGFRVILLSTTIPDHVQALADATVKPAAAKVEGAAASKFVAKTALTLKRHVGAVTRVAFHPSLPLLASAGKDGAVFLWRTDDQSFKELGKYKVEVWALKFSPNGEAVAFGSRDWWKSEVVLSSVNSGRRITSLGDFKYGGGAVASIAFSSDGALFAAGQDDGTIRLWSTASFQEIAPLSVGSNVLGLAFGPTLVDRKHKRSTYVLAAGCQDGALNMLMVTVASNKRDFTFVPSGTPFPHGGAVLGLRFSPNGELLACARAGGLIALYDPITGAVMREIKGAVGEVNWIAFHPWFPWIITAHKNERVARISSAETGERLCELKGHTGGVLCAEFSRDGRRVATASEDFSIRLWDLNAAEFETLRPRARKGKAALPLVGD